MLILLLLMILSFVKNGKTVDNKERNGGIREFESKGGGGLSAGNTLLGKLTVDSAANVREILFSAPVIFLLISTATVNYFIMDTCHFCCAKVRVGTH